MLFLHSITPLVEIFVIAVIINYLLTFFWNTKSMDLMMGLIAFLLIFAATSWLNLPILHTLLLVVSNAAVIGILIIFQPELRMALSKLSVKGKKFKEQTSFDKFLEELTLSAYKFSERRIGALIVLEKEDVLDEYSNKAVRLDAQFSCELLESIFTTSTPLHDGAVIIRDEKIIAAAVILPLSEDSSQIAKSIGTRHRAALGISQITDAVVVIVSEESGKVSIAREGIITRGIKADKFRGIIRSIFTSSSQKKFKSHFNVKEWIRQ